MDLLADPDAHLRKIVSLHFDDEYGSKFWNELKKNLSFDPIEDIREISDLQLFREDNSYSSFPADRLKEEPKSFIPRRYDDKEFRLYSTGGRTGTPKWTAWTEDGFDRMLKICNNLLDRNDVERGTDCVHIGPTGPHAFGYAMRDLAQRRGGSFLTIDLDPRWVRKAKVDNSLRESGADEAYIEHLKSQTQDVLSQFGKDVGIFISTPTVIGLLAEGGALNPLDLDAVIFAGQAMKPENHPALETMLNIPVLGIYGNTLAGISPQIDFDGDRGQIIYQTMPSLSVYDITVRDGSFESVEYGTRGQVVAHVVREGLFAPYLVESDAATRRSPEQGERFDRVANPDIPQTKKDQIESGVY